MENNVNLRVGTNTNQENEYQKLELKIDGISCQACVAKIERKLSRTSGVEKPLSIFQIIWQILNMIKRNKS